MEQRLIELTKENTILKNRLQQQHDFASPATNLQSLPHHDSVIVAGPKYETASLPAPSITAYTDYVNPAGASTKLQAVFPQLLGANPLLASGPSPTLPSQSIPMLHLCHLQAAFQTQQVSKTSPHRFSVRSINNLQNGFHLQRLI